MGEVCVVNDGVVVVEDGIGAGNELKRDLQCLIEDDGIVEGSPRKKKALEVLSSEDVFSGISDPIVSNCDQSAVNLGSPRVESEGHSGVGSGGMVSTSFSSGSGTTGSSVCEENDIRERCSSGGESISDVVLELPKDASSRRR